MALALSPKREPSVSAKAPSCANMYRSFFQLLLRSRTSDTRST
jgi:hypothetical protein